MNIFDISCISDESTSNLVYAKDAYQSLAGNSYNYLYNLVPRQDYTVVIISTDYVQKAQVYSWLNKYAQSVWGFALPLINDARITNPGYGLDLGGYFMKTICAAPAYKIVDTDGSAKIVNGFLTFGTSTYAHVRRFVSCILTSDIAISSFNNPNGHCKFSFSLSEVAN